MARLTDEIKTQLEKMDSMQEIELFQKKDVVYSREYATTPDMKCPTCGKTLLTTYPRFCSDCGTRLHYKYAEEDFDY